VNFDKYMAITAFVRAIMALKKINFNITPATNSSLYLSKNLHLWQVFSKVSVVKGCVQYMQISHHGLIVWELLRDMSVLSIKLIYIL
jgi:hypothetical protein